MKSYKLTDLYTLDLGGKDDSKFKNLNKRRKLSAEMGDLDIGSTIVCVRSMLI